MALDKKVTISDIAKLSGVSKATVSRYINGKQNLMRPETSERIKTSIDLLDYHPSDAARSLKNKKAKLIGVVLADMSLPFSSALVVAIESYLASKGYIPLFMNTNENPQKEAHAIKSLVSRDVAGLLVNTASCFNNELIQVACKGMPVVLCDRYVNDYSFCAVTVEVRNSILNMVRHLKEAGYTRPVFLTQNWETNSTRRRKKEAFVDAVQEVYGIQSASDIYIISRKSGVTAESQIKRLMQCLKPGDIPAILGSNSYTTIVAYHAIRSLGLSIPSDIGLCGPEDWNWADDMNWPLLLQPNITTIFIPTDVMGKKVAEMLIDLVEGREIEKKVLELPCEILVRGSTAYRKAHL